MDADLVTERRIFRSAIVPAEYAGQRFDQAAAKLWPEFSRSRLQQWIDAGCLTAAGAVWPSKARVSGGEQLVLDAQMQAQVPLRAEQIPLQIVHADAGVFVVDKPAGLVVHPGAGNPAGTLQNALLHLDPSLAQVPRAGIVHRLDKDTSGLLVVARTLQSQAALAAQIEAREIARTYEAICAGVLTGGGEIEAPLGRHPRDRKRQSVRQDGRRARTRYWVRERFRAHTHIEVSLDTGRTHQIRVHMAHIRAPLLGDPLYGGRPKLPRAPTAELVEAVQGFPRQALHAVRLAFRHPLTGEPLTFHSPLAADLQALLEALRADAGTAR
ncbi:MAG: 23S rRNA pseudouridine(1911/1915/1917) synthase RluD [Gammaproteobacteria bacterium]